jgi:hypothetical protein
VTQCYLSHGPSWQANDIPQGGYGGPHMFLPQQFTGHGPSSTGAPRMPPAPPGKQSCHSADIFHLHYTITPPQHNWKTPH